MTDKQVISLLRRIAMDQAYLMDAIDMLLDDVGSSFGEEYTKWKSRRREFIKQLEQEAEDENNG